ncbi:hypothetical protein N864_17035 [Intrasporangium chromatireducens Q5-1]|uniref:Uncharacterized protein n=2 Tax=Intrasporangium TaxID=53357 RepID=W9GH16_9MICO|nr:hypothetical protein N864_17035 [Intrasporangium chromatireducens Q5-1]
MIGAMTPGPSVVRAPAPHRAVAAVGSVVVGYFVARLLLHVTALPPEVAYGVCLAIALYLAYRAWQARIDLTPETARVHNTLATTKVHRHDIRRVREDGSIEWHQGAARATRLPSEALRCPWWAFGQGARDYRHNRERLRSWHRVAR